MTLEKSVLRKINELIDRIDKNNSHNLELLFELNHISSELFLIKEMLVEISEDKDLRELEVKIKDMNFVDVYTDPKIKDLEEMDSDRVLN